MKNLLSIVLFAGIFTLGSCGGGTETQTQAEEPTAEEKVEVQKMDSVSAEISNEASDVEAEVDDILNDLKDEE